MKNITHVWSYFAQFYLEWEMFQANIIEPIKTNVLFQN